MKFSKFGEKFTQQSSILQLMDDLGDALKSDKPVQMLGGGNPAKIDAVNDVFKQMLNELATGEQGIESMGNYSNPQGDQAFIDALVTLLRDKYQLNVNAANIALTNGSQSAFFYLFNLFSGEYGDGSHKNILFPLVPEYVGYADVHIDSAHFSAVKPLVEETTYNGRAGFFKYRVDFDALENHPDLLAGNVGAICCSRPANPTGNMLSDEEIYKLKTIAKKHSIPLIVDNAYGLPFPNIIHTDATLAWDDDCILCLSLSKIGMPGMRTGIIVANEETIAAISALNAIISLSPVRFGATLTTSLLNNGGLQKLSNDVIQPFYKKKSQYAISLLQKEFTNYPVKIHQPEGAIFLWLWFSELPVTSLKLYEILKTRGTIIIPGEHFFLGINTADYPHANECIRLSVAADDATLDKGIATLGEVVRELYAQGKAS